MTGVIIISAIILLFAFLLNMKIRAEISYLGGSFNFKVKYLCFTIFPLKEKKKKEKKRNTKIKKSKKTNPKTVTAESMTDMQNSIGQTEKIKQNDIEQVSEKGKKKSEKKNKNKDSLSDKIDKLFEMLEKVKIVWSVSKKHLAHTFKYIYFEDLMVDFIIADEDAYKTAMNYGKVNAAVFNLINFIRTFFTVTIKTVDVICDFDSKESVYDFSTKITVKPSTILSAVFGILFGLLINIKKLIGKNNMKQSSNEKAVSM